ncbi:hypothetical protein PM082_024749 [Marasmius tenuissimus]|nr:hypothetical protein PM082_024749 [Marasmius tenuissimus]
MGSLFANPTNLRIGDNATIQSVGRDVTTNIYHSGREDVIELYGNMFRNVLMGDIMARRAVSSEVLEVTVEPPLRDITSTPPLPQSRVMKVRKTVQHAEIMGLLGRFTTISVEPLDASQEGFESISERVCRELASQRSPLFPQLVGIGRSKWPTWIVHDGKSF